MLSRMRRWRVGRSSRRVPEGIPGVWRGRATQKCAQLAPSLRVAAKKRGCVVARLANISRYALRLAPSIHRFLAEQRIRDSMPERLLKLHHLEVFLARAAFGAGPVRRHVLPARSRRRCLRRGRPLLRRRSSRRSGTCIFSFSKAGWSKIVHSTKPRGAPRATRARDDPRHALRPEPEFPPLVLAFAASDPSGGAGMQADILTLASMGCHPLSVLTAITVQDTLGVEGIMALDAEWVADQARCLLEDMPVDAFKIGVLGSVENIAAIAEIVSDYPDVPLVLDPVLASGRGDELASDDDDRARCASSCCRRRRSSRPTARSAPARRGRRRRRAVARRRARAALLELGAEYVLITGTHEATPQVVNTLYGQDGVVRTDTWQRLPGSYHGSGCTLASAIAAMLANGLELPEAVREAQDYTWHTLKKAYRPGMGQFLPDRLFWARDDRARPANEAEAPRAADAGSSIDDALARRRARARRIAGSTRSRPISPTPPISPRASTRRSPAARRRSSIATSRPTPRCGVRRRWRSRACTRCAARFSSSTTTPRSPRRSAPTACTSARTTVDRRRAREIVGPDRLVGVSCYNDLERARAAVAAGADYVAFGSFFPSTVKPDARRAELDAPRGARARFDVPVVAIGGITADNAAALLRAGADAVAVITAVFDAPDVEAAARAIARPLSLFDRLRRRRSTDDEPATTTSSRARSARFPPASIRRCAPFARSAARRGSSSAARAPYLWDADGKRYIDYVGSWGPAILGHAHPAVVQAVRDIAPQGPVVRRADRAIEIEMAETLCRLAAVDRDGAARVVGHRGDDVGAAARARLHRAQQDRQVRRLLPRPRRQPAREGGLGRADVRPAVVGRRAAGHRERDDRAAVQRPRRGRGGVRQGRRGHRVHHRRAGRRQHEPDHAAGPASCRGCAPSATSTARC